MNKSILILFSSLIIVIIPFLYSYLKSKKEAVTGDDWTVGGRDLPTYVVVGTQFATALGGGVLTGIVGIAYDFGLSAMTYVMIGCVPFFILMVIAPWIRKNNFTTIPDMLERFYGEHKGMAVLGALFALFVPFGWLMSQLISFGLLFSGITGINQHVLVVGLTIASLFLIMPSGLKTVAFTDFILSVMMIFICAVTIVYAFNVAGGVSAVFSSPNIPAGNNVFPSGLWAVGGSTALLWVFSSIPGASTNQMFYQRVCSMKDEKKVNFSLKVSALAVFCIGTWAYLFGTVIRSINNTLPAGQNATGWFITQMPTWLLVLFSGLFCGAIISTISSAAQTAVTNMTKDIYQKTINTNAKDEDMVRLARILTVVLMATTCTLAIFYPNVMAWLVYTYAFSAAGLLGPIFVGYFTKDKRTFSGQTVFISMVISMVVCVVAKLNNSFGTPIPFTLFGVAACIIAMYVLSSVSGDNEKKQIV